MIAMTNKTLKKKLNFKEKLNEDHLDLSLCSLETVPIKEIVSIINRKYLLWYYQVDILNKI